jgi:hypothetical protein
VDALNSVIYVYGLQPAVDNFPKIPGSVSSGTSGTSGSHSFEGLWWKHEANVSGFLALSNLSSTVINATIQVTDSADAVLGTYQVAITPQGTKMVDLAEIKSSTATTGGIYLTHDGIEHSLAINGAVFDNAVGYSARLAMLAVPASPAPGTPPSVSQFTYSQLGLMSGAADPMMNFPAGTVFTPYSVVRNISNEPASVTPRLWWMAGARAQSAQLPQVTVPARRTVNLNAPALLTAAGLKNYNGSANLVLAISAQAGALVMNSGSVDASNTYVFEVVPHGVVESSGKAISYWSTANGDDTMFTLWNPADEDQDLVFTLYFLGGHYAYPIHLLARATRTFNVSEISGSAIPDAEGNVVPAGIREGSAEITGARRATAHPGERRRGHL